MPDRITAFRYNCGSEYFLDPLYAMLGDTETYGIITIEAGEAAIAWIRGSYLHPPKIISYPVPGKQSQGGQSQARYVRRRNEAMHNFCKVVGIQANQIFLNIKGLSGILISGPGMTKLAFLKQGTLDYRLQDKILSIIDVGYSGAAGVRETIQRAGNVLKNLRYVKEQSWVEEFFTRFLREDPLIAYAQPQVEEALRIGQVHTLYLVDNLSSPVLEGAISMASRFGTTIEVLSSKTEAGEMFAHTFGGWGAMLRYST